MVQNLQAVIFDLDDTLVDKSETLRAVAAIQYSSFSLNNFGVSFEDWKTQFVELNNLRIEKSEVFNRLGQRFSFAADLRGSLGSHFDQIFGYHVRPFPGAIETIQACKSNGLKIGIITNGRDAFQRSKIAGAGITDLIDIVVTSGGVGIKKPDIRIFELALESLQVLPQETAFVGDDYVADMQPAIKLGMCSVWKSADSSPEVSFSSNDFGEIRDFLVGRDFS